MNQPGLWEFSLELYAAPGVADALLSLQRRHRADVNLLLYAAWHALSGRGVLSRARLAELDEGLAHWRGAVILPLREMRERIKREPELHALPGAAAAREQVLAAELAAEHVAQRWLQQVTEEGGVQRSADAAVADCRASLAAYFAHLGGELGEADQADCEVLLAAL